MEELAKISRVLRLIKLLADKPTRNVKELGKLLETSDKTIYRYIKLLEELGYLIDKDAENRYFLFEDTVLIHALWDSVELDILKVLINTMETSHPLQESIRRKLYLSSNLVPLAEELIDRGQARILMLIKTAIGEGKKIKILKYQSANSNEISDRIVDPIALVRSDSQLSAYDVEKQDYRHYKIKRMQGVVVLDQKQSALHQDTFTDIFGFTSNQHFIVKLDLKKRAYRLLIEEYPESRPFMADQDGEFPYRFVCKITDNTGVGRFILGLPGEIKIAEPYELKAYIKNKLKGFLD